MRTVLVTGANGHVCYNVAKLLRSKGYNVRASVRDLSNPKKTSHLRALGVELVEADIMKPETLTGAVAGVDGVFQIAAVYRIWAPDPENDIIAPGVTGGLNVLRAAKEAGVKRVVLTSSCAAVGSDATEANPLTENDWNDAATSPYYVAKTRGEREAWKFAKETGLDLVTINPCAIIGPGFYRHTPSTETFELLLRGKLPAVPPIAFSFVDVRDVASAHVLAYENPQAKGRYITAAAHYRMMDLMKYIKEEIDPDVKVPKFELPKAAIPVISSLDWLANKVARTPRQLPKDLADEMIGKTQIVSSEKIRRELGWQPLPFEQSLKDTLDWIRQEFIDKKTAA